MLNVVGQAADKAFFHCLPGEELNWLLFRWSAAVARQPPGVQPLALASPPSIGGGLETSRRRTNGKAEQAQWLEIQFAPRIFGQGH
jgi:hypothetical protein